MVDDAPLDCSGLDPASLDHPLASRRRGRGPRPSGNYERHLEFIRNAIATDAPPSPELIAENKQLAAWEAYLGIGELSSFPVALHLAITDVCNARCLFCSYTPENATNRTVRLSDIARADWLKFVERFYPNSALGDPLVHPEIVPILRRIREQAPFVKMGMTTNAALLSNEIVEAITGHLHSMAVSLNAARRQTYEIVMAPLKWDVTIDNLKRLTSRMREQGTDKPEIQGSVVVHRHNLDELPEMPALLKSIGIDRMRVLVMTLPKPVASRKLYGPEDLIHHEPRKANRIFAELRQECAVHNVAIVGQLPTLAET